MKHPWNTCVTERSGNRRPLSPACETVWNSLKPIETVWNQMNQIDTVWNVVIRIESWSETPGETLRNTMKQNKSFWNGMIRIESDWNGQETSGKHLKPIETPGNAWEPPLHWARVPAARMLTKFLASQFSVLLKIIILIFSRWLVMQWLLLLLQVYLLHKRCESGILAPWRWGLNTLRQLFAGFVRWYTVH